MPSSLKPLNPQLALLQPYPFERLRQLFAGVTPAAAAAVPSEAAAVPCRKRRRLKPRALFSDIVSPDSSVDLFLPAWRKVKPQRGAGMSNFLSKHGAGARRPPASGRFTANAAPTKGTCARHQPLWWRGNGAPRKQQKPQTAAVGRPLPRPEVHSGQVPGRLRSRPRPLPCPLRRPP